MQEQAKEKTKWTWKQMGFMSIVSLLTLSGLLENNVPAEWQGLVKGAYRLLFAIFFFGLLGVAISASWRGDRQRSLTHDSDDKIPLMFGDWTASSRSRLEYAYILCNCVFACIMLFGVFKISIQPYLEEYNPNISFESFDDIAGNIIIVLGPICLPLFFVTAWLLNKQAIQNEADRAVPSQNKTD